MVECLVVGAGTDVQREAPGFVFVVQDDARAVRVEDQWVLQRDAEQLVHVNADQDDLAQRNTELVFLVIRLQVLLAELVLCIIINELKPLVHGQDFWDEEDLVGVVDALCHALHVDGLLEIDLGPTSGLVTLTDTYQLSLSILISLLNLSA